MSNLPLAGCRVLVTRPTGQQSELIEAIEAQGGHPLSLPLLTIEPIPNTKQDTHAKHGTPTHAKHATPTRATWDTHAKESQNHGTPIPKSWDTHPKIMGHPSQNDEYDLLIFVSVNAARFGAELINEHGAGISSAADLLAVGAATAREAASLFGRPVHGPVGGGSEKLLELPLLDDVKGKRVAIFRGEGGRELLAEELRRRGAIVDYFEVYRRIPATDAAQRLREILAQTMPDIAVITSAEALAHWCEIACEFDMGVPQKTPESMGVPQQAFALPLQANEEVGRGAAHLLRIPVVVPSRRVAELAARHGVATVVNAGEAGAKAMVEALAAHWRQPKP